MKISLPDTEGRMTEYRLTGTPIAQASLPANPARGLCRRACGHRPFTAADPSGAGTIDWDGTMRFRRHLAGLGLGIAEAMDTAQRGMALTGRGALDLIRRTREELPDALVGNGCSTDHLNPADARGTDDVIRAYLEQMHAIQKLDGRLILMASRALARTAKGPQDYVDVYSRVLSRPIIR